jgi:hypothetical protein
MSPRRRTSTTAAARDDSTANNETNANSTMMDVDDTSELSTQEPTNQASVSTQESTGNGAIQQTTNGTSDSILASNTTVRSAPENQSQWICKINPMTNGISYESEGICDFCRSSTENPLKLSGCR